VGIAPRFKWQREQWCALPDIPYVGIVLTIPNVLWPIFRQNRHLLHDLPKLGAAVIAQWVKLKYGVRVQLMVIPHTFGGRLNFNSHLHILVSAGQQWAAPTHFFEMDFCFSCTSRERRWGVRAG
jgi:hypothetical protein